MSDDVELDYDFMMQRAFRYLMRDVLSLVSDVGDAPGEHHFYIDFLTTAPGVSIPDFLLQDYPERMTIVLQHQFEQLTVDDDSFGVTLRFKGREARLEVPFGAVISFTDPSVEFGLRFEPAPQEDDEIGAKVAASLTDAEANPTPEKADDETADEKTDDADKDGAEIVSLDAFRKK